MKFIDRYILPILFGLTVGWAVGEIIYYIIILLK